MRSTPKIEDAEKLARTMPRTTSMTVYGIRILLETIEATTVMTRKPAMIVSAEGILSRLPPRPQGPMLDYCSADLDALDVPIIRVLGEVKVAVSVHLERVLLCL